VNWWRTVVVANNEYPPRGKLTDVGLAASRGGSASSPYHRGTEEKAKVVPGSGVVHLVDGDLVVEKRNDERKRQDEPVPQPKPKAGYGTIRAGRIPEKVRSRGTASREAEGEHEEEAQDSEQWYLHESSRTVGA